MMLTVFCACSDRLAAHILSDLAKVPQIEILGPTNDVRETLQQCAQSPPDLLLIEDTLLRHNTGVIAALAAHAYPIAVLTLAPHPDTPRHALAIHAQTVINVATDHPHWTTVIAELTGAASPDAPTAGTVLLFFSPKGGVGKTTIGLNLAVALGQILRQPVAFVDADLQFGDAAAMIPEAPRTTLYDVTQSHVGHDLDLVLRTVTPVTPFVDLLPAPRDPQEAEEITPEALTQVLTTLRSHYTVIVVDTAPALTDITLALIDQADTIVLVCTPERLTIRKMAKTIQVLTHGLHLPPSRLLCLLNRAASVPGFTPDEVSAALHLPIALTLPSDGAYPIRAANLGQPLLLRFPEAALSRALVHWARQFVYAAPSVPNPQRSGQPVLFPAGSSRLS